MEKGTVLITGASGGIGEALAHTFAQNGWNLVLVARTEAKLHALADMLAQQHAVSAAVILADLTDPNAPERICVTLGVQGIVVDILVNNAGFASYGAFAEEDIRKQGELLMVNVMALTELTRRLLPGMKERQGGRILNVASTAAFMPGPLMAVYYASKAYVLSLSEALAEELRGTGVTVTCLCPGPTETGFQSRAAMQDSKLVKSRPLMSAATVAQAGYQATLRGQVVVIPGLMNQIQALAPRLLPRRWLPGIVKNAQAQSH